MIKLKQKEQKLGNYWFDEMLDFEKRIRNAGFQISWVGSFYEFEKDQTNALNWRCNILADCASDELKIQCIVGDFYNDRKCIQFKVNIQKTFITAKEYIKYD